MKNNNFIKKDRILCKMHVLHILHLLHFRLLFAYFLLEKTNNVSISWLIQESLSNNIFILPNTIPSDKIVLILIDAAAYMVMIKTWIFLKIFYPNLITSRPWKLLLRIFKCEHISKESQPKKQKRIGKRCSYPNFSFWQYIKRSAFNWKILFTTLL